MRNIKVKDEVWEKLMKMKIDSRKKTVNDIIEELLKGKKNEKKK